MNMQNKKHPRIASDTGVKNVLLCRACVESVVDSLLFHEALVVSSFDYPAVLKHHDSMGIAYSRQSVSNNEYRSALHERIHTLFDK